MPIKGERSWVYTLITTGGKKNDLVLRLFQRAEGADVVIMLRNLFHCYTKENFCHSAREKCLKQSIFSFQITLCLKDEKPDVVPWKISLKTLINDKLSYRYH